MERRDEKRFILFTTTALVLVLLLSGVQSLGLEGLGGSGSLEREPTDGRRGYPGVEVGYIDDTRDGDDYTWAVLISSTRDMGVLWINNTGTVLDTYAVLVSSAPDGWVVTPDRMAVPVQPEGEMGVVLLSYEVPPGTTGMHRINITVESQTDPSVRQVVSLLCDVEGTGAKTVGMGDTIMVDYWLTDEEGNELDSGTLPVTAGEMYVGPGNTLRYIEGFYLAPLGMRAPSVGILRGLPGETKTVRLPPELAYGSKPPEEGGHQLGGMTLIFTITVLTQDPL